MTHDEPNAETLTTAQRIKAARIEKGWTQKQLAEASGIQQAKISSYERGRYAPNAATVDKIMRAIGSSHILAAVDGVLGIQGRTAGKLVVVDPTATPTPVDWIVEGFVARGFLTMVAGEPGAGKSMVTQTVAVGLVEGRDHAAGFKLHARHVDVECTDPECDYLAQRDPRVDSAVHSHRRLDSRALVLDAENGPNLIQERVQSMGLDNDAAERFIVAASDGFDIYKDRKDLDGMLADYRDAGTPIDLLVLDSWTSLWFGNENVVEQVMGVLKYLNTLADRFGLGILLIHHTDKEGETYRGSSAIAATIGGGVFTFSRFNEKDGEDFTARQITCKKMRIAAEPERMKVYVTSHGVDVEPETSADRIALSVADRTKASAMGIDTALRATLARGHCRVCDVPCRMNDDLCDEHAGL